MGVAQRLSQRPTRPMPVLRVPRPETRKPARSEPRVSLHSVDLEVLEATPPAERKTLLTPHPEDDPIDIVIEALRNASCESAIEAASLCLAWCARAVRCRAALVHLYDPRSHEFVVVYALGERAGYLLLTRHAAMDDALAAAVVKGSPRVDNYGGGKRRAPQRYAFFGGAWSALVAPVMDGERILGAIELVDPLDGSCFDENAIAASCYVTKRLAELLAPFGGKIGAVIRPPDE
jgi:hypothetical protein